MSLFTPVSWNDLPFILQGVLNTVYISIVAIIIGSILGAIVGFIRHIVGKTTNMIIGVFLDVLRTVPLIIQLILFHTYLGIIGYSSDPFVVGALVLSLYTTAFMSEVFRGGFDSTNKSLLLASHSLGMSFFQTTRYVHFPIALRTVLPAWLTVALSTIKDSALVSVIGYMEMLRTAEQLIGRSQQALEILIGVGVFYFIVSYPLALYGKHLEKKLSYD